MGYFSRSFTNLVNIIASPATAFSSLREHPTAGFPFLLLMVAWSVLWIWYYGAVDFAWMKSYEISVQTLNSSAEQRDAISQGIGAMKPGAFLFLSIVFSGVVMIVVALVMAVYLVICDAVLDDKLGFRHWFALAMWSLIPALFTILAMAANFALADGNRIATEQLNPISLNNLIFHAGPGNPYRRMLDLDLAAIWSWLLMVVGYRTWTNRSVLTSMAIVLAPIVAVYAIWIGVVLL